MNINYVYFQSKYWKAENRIFSIVHLVNNRMEKIIFLQKEEGR